MPDLHIAGVEIPRGERKRFEIPVATLFDYTQLNIPVEVIRGKDDGPTLFISAAIHGDEIIGTEIVKRILERKELEKIKGTLICIPIVNPFGYNNNIRYLPDRRDLNRCFPGSPDGSLAARMAHTFLNEIVLKSNYGIDIHSAAIHRTNFPQIRLEIEAGEDLQLANSFGAPVILHSPLRPGTLRKEAKEKGIKVLLFEGGEALRFDDYAVNVCITGILNVMRTIKMLPQRKHYDAVHTVVVAKSSHWIRANASGSLRTIKKLGSFVQAGDLLGVISDPFGDRKLEVHASKPGIVIAAITMPLVNRGNALFHIATLDEMKFVDEKVDKDIVLDQDIDIENEDWFNRK
jgi:predicted deacylase